MGDDGAGPRARLQAVWRRVLAVWRRVLALSWPVMLEQTFRTAMRTTDIVVTALFSPVAVAAIGLADLYARFPLWVGLGFGGGAIALSSQDTGSGADANRDEAISGAVILGALLGVPFVAFGFLFGQEAIAILGAPPAVAEQGGTYLTLIFATAPARHVGLIAARSLQGTGDTRTPMYVNVAGNLLNISLSAVLGLGLFGAPRLEVFGVGLATALANVLIAVALLAALAGPWADANLTVPSDVVVARQLVAVSGPSVAEGLASTIAEFPLNAILLGFGTEVNAAFQIGRRVYQQVTSPLSRGLNVGSSVLVGQALGAGDAARARFDGWATAALGVATVGAIGLVLVAAAPALAGLLVENPETRRTTVAFARVYGLTAVPLATFITLQGALRGASETRVPFVARTTGMFGSMVGVTYLLGVVLDYGVLGAYVGIAGTFVWMAAVVTGYFWRGNWAERATELMVARGSMTQD